MTQCVQVTTAVIDRVTYQLVTASSADPCPGHVLLSAAEFAHLALNPFVLTLEQGAALSVAIAAVWAVAWAFRALASVASTDGVSTSQE